jgi:hypothetical protein
LCGAKLNGYSRAYFTSSQQYNQLSSVISLISLSDGRRAALSIARSLQKQQ